MVLCICDSNSHAKVTSSGNFLDCVTACAAALYAPDRGHGLNHDRTSLGATVLRLCEPAVRRWSTSREVTGRDCSFAEFQSTDSDRYESEKGSRSDHARRGVEPTRSNPASVDGPSGGSVLRLGGLSFLEVREQPRTNTAKREGRTLVGSRQSEVGSLKSTVVLPKWFSGVLCASAATLRPLR